MENRNPSHIFNISDAIEYGVDGAIVLHNIRHWVEKNESNEKHFYDGRYWTYNSQKAFSLLFPYWTERQIRRIIDKLLEKGALVAGNYNTNKYDRTLWYSVAGECIRPNGQMELTETSNGTDRNVGPIPYINSDSKPNVSNTSLSDKGQGYSEERLKQIASVVDILNAECDTSFRSSSAATRKHINARIEEGYHRVDFESVVKFKHEEWGGDPKMSEYLRPITLFGTKFESYLQAAKREGY